MRARSTLATSGRRRTHGDRTRHAANALGLLIGFAYGLIYRRRSEDPAVTFMQGYNLGHSDGLDRGYLLRAEDEERVG